MNHDGGIDRPKDPADDPRRTTRQYSIGGAGKRWQSDGRGVQHQARFVGAAGRPLVLPGQPHG
jgi:hypothetical protein